MELAAATKVGKMADHLRSMRDAKRLEHLDEENDRLRAELQMTKSELEREREREERVLDALNKASERKTKIKAKSKGGFLRLLVVGGAAYVFGTKAGQQRYEQIRSWFSSVTDRVAESRSTEPDASRGAMDSASAASSKTKSDGSTGSEHTPRSS